MPLSQRFDLDYATEVRKAGLRLLGAPGAHQDVFAYLVAALGPVRAVQIEAEMSRVWADGRRDADPVEMDMVCHPLIRVPF
jgi:hypothetical protein